MNTLDDGENDRTDDAMAARLARLRHRPLAMGSLGHRVREHIATHRPVYPVRRWNGPLRALAVSLLLAGTIVVVALTMRGSAVLVSPAEWSLIHRENVSGDPHAVLVGSMESAERILTLEWKECPRLPETPLAAVLSCHMHRLGAKRFACLAMTVDGLPVTLAVARAGDVRIPESSRVSRNGFNYGVQSSGSVNIVVALRDDHWFCLMGELPAERLLDVAASFPT